MKKAHVCPDCGQPWLKHKIAKTTPLSKYANARPKLTWLCPDPEESRDT